MLKHLNGTKAKLIPVATEILDTLQAMPSGVTSRLYSATDNDIYNRKKPLPEVTRRYRRMNELRAAYCVSKSTIFSSQSYRQAKQDPVAIESLTLEEALLRFNDCTSDCTPKRHQTIDIIRLTQDDVLAKLRKIYHAKCRLLQPDKILGTILNSLS